MSALRLWLVQLVVIVSCCEAYKILVVFPVPASSHKILGDGIVRHLVKDGHEVTYISPYPYKPESTNVRRIDVSANVKAIPEGELKISGLMSKEFVIDHTMLMHMFTEITKMTIENENVQNLLKDPKERFDVVIAEWMFGELYSGLAAVFDCPLIWFSSTDVHWTILRLIDQPSNPAYTADPISSVLPPFTFLQRVKELYTQLKVMYMKYTIFDKMDEQVYDKSLAPIITKRGRQPPSFVDVKYNASLLFANSHVSHAPAIPIPQHCISIGGYFIEENVKPLPADLKKIMDDAKNGVIYFSLGSNLKSTHLPKELKDGILEVFGKLKQTVLWKFEEDLPNKPKNVHILKWAPQQSILSHPHTVLFITHGGLLSTIETIHFGVPIIGIPVFSDQFMNVARAVQQGFAQKVDLSYTMAGELEKAIEEVITNPKYSDKAKQLSLIYHDRPVSPGKELVHWVKHVVKTGGASHLRSPALNVPFYQKLYLDLLAVILVILISIVILLKRVCRSLGSKNDVSSRKKNK